MTDDEDTRYGVEEERPVLGRLCGDAMQSLRVALRCSPEASVSTPGDGEPWPSVLGRVDVARLEAGPPEDP